MKKSKKSSLIEKHKKHGKDTGSHPLQVALLTERIGEVQSHLAKHPKDNHSRRGLLMMVGKRRKLLSYLSNSNPVEYESTLDKLKLRK